MQGEAALGPLSADPVLVRQGLAPKVTVTSPAQLRAVPTWSRQQAVMDCITHLLKDTHSRARG